MLFILFTAPLKGFKVLVEGLEAFGRYFRENFQPFKLKISFSFHILILLTFLILIIPPLYI
jgi:hypothetical protein